MKKFVQRLRQYFAAKRHQRLVSAAESIFQIKEYEGNLWITYDGNLVMPISMLKNIILDSSDGTLDSAIKHIITMREEFIKRNEKDCDYDTRFIHTIC